MAHLPQPPIKEELATSPVPVHVFSLADSQNVLSSPTDKSFPDPADERNENMLSDSNSTSFHREQVNQVGNYSSSQIPSSQLSPQNTSSPSKNTLLHFLASDNMDLDPEGQSAMLGIFEKQFARKLSDVDSKIVVLEKEINTDEAAMQLKREEILLAESHLAELKEQLRNMQSSFEKKGVKRKAMVDERDSLKRKVSMCEVTKQEMTKP